jgi:hypothetical protein
LPENEVFGFFIAEKERIMKNNNRILVAILTATTLLLFMPISAYTDWGTTQDIDSSFNADHSTTNNLIVEPAVSPEKTEQWELILDGGLGYANVILIQKQDGTIISDGNWVYNYHGSNVSGPYVDAPVTIVGTSMSIKALGTATNSSAPPGYKTSPYSVKINGTALDGQGTGTFAISFQTVGWPNMVVISWAGKRISGSGITAETEQAKAMPWFFLLLK